MLRVDTGDTATGRAAMDNATVRTLFVIGPDKKTKLTISYPMMRIGAMRDPQMGAEQRP